MPAVCVCVHIFCIQDDKFLRIRSFATVPVKALPTLPTVFTSGMLVMIRVFLPAVVLDSGEPAAADQRERGEGGPPADVGARRLHHQPQDRSRALSAQARCGGALSRESGVKKHFLLAYFVSRWVERCSGPGKTRNIGGQRTVANKHHDERY